MWQYQSENKVGQPVAYPQQVFTTAPFVAVLIAADISAFGDISTVFEIFFQRQILRYWMMIWSHLFYTTA